MELALAQSNTKLYLQEPARIVKVKNFTEHEKFFQIELLRKGSLGHDPGQFVEVSILGIGEAPISIASPPDSGNRFDLCARAVGDVTKKLFTFKKNDLIYIRGPFGHGFDDKIFQRMRGKHLLFIAGGIGYFPLRSLINQVIPNAKNYKKISILYGCKTSQDRMFPDELKKIHHLSVGSNVELLETLDHPEADWTGNVGVITTLIPKIDFDPAETIAIIVGPPIMYKFVLTSLMDKHMPKENIYMSLERRMKCGVGKCGHCQMEGVYVCQKGPVFNYADVEHNEELF